MQAEVRRALAFKARLAPVPPEKHIIFFCNLKQTMDQIDWNLLRRVGTIVIAGFESPYDSGQHGDGTVPADSANPIGAAQTVAVNGSHMWIPGMQIVHMGLRNFLAGP